MSRFLLVVLALFAVSDLVIICRCLFSHHMCSHLMLIFLQRFNHRLQTFRLPLLVLKPMFHHLVQLHQVHNKYGRHTIHDHTWQVSSFIIWIRVFSEVPTWLLHLNLSDSIDFSSLSSSSPATSSRLKVLYGRMMQRIFKLWPTSARLVNYTKRDYDND